MTPGNNKLKAAFKRISYDSWKLIFSVAVLAAIFDQITKLLVLESLHVGESVEIIPGYFNLTLTFNKGAAFGVLASVADGSRQILLALTTSLALTVVMYFLLFEYFADRIAQIALAMIVGGAMGNIIDRLFYGKVVDFLDAYYGDYHWPAFNVADSCICVAVFILLFRKPSRLNDPV